MNFRLLGCILLIVGSAIGAGMLALPITTSQLGFFGSFLLLCGCWVVMTASAYLLLEVNLWLPSNSNLVSMAKVTIGPVGQIISWITYLLLLYSLLCAYIAGGSDLFHTLLGRMGFQVSQTIAAIVFTCVFGSVVLLGIRSVDYVNRGLMFFKLGAYLLLVLLLIPLITTSNLTVSDMGNMTSDAWKIAITVTITSFGFAAIIPSIRVYCHSNVKQIKLAILVGSIIPLVCYLLFIAAIMGIIPLHGSQGLLAILQSKTSNSDLVKSVSTLANENSVTIFANLFISICVLTSFLGVALCLTDFLADGFQMEKKGRSGILIHALTFLPPLLIVIFFPNVFIKALEYAGIYCVILLIILPVWMTWNGRYRRHVAKGYQVPGGKLLLLVLAGFGIAMLIFSIAVTVMNVMH